MIRNNGFKKKSSSPENLIFFTGTKATLSLDRQSPEMAPSILLKENLERYMELSHLSTLQANLDGDRKAMAPKKPLYFLLQIRKFLSIPER
jgi:hypothetical protein